MRADGAKTGASDRMSLLEKRAGARRFVWGRRWAKGGRPPAVNYACTGHFGNVPEDIHLDLHQLELFLIFERADLPCSLFPHDAPATFFFDGIDTPNVEMPLYLMGLFGLLW